MTMAHIALLVIAFLMGAEAIWTIASPAAMRDRVQRMLNETEEDAGMWRVTFWSLALFVWLFAWHGNLWVHRTLFFIGVFFMATGFAAYRPTFMAAWFDFFLGRRSVRTIRLLYMGELLLAAGFGWVAITGR